MYPWLACLYVEEGFRGKEVGSMLLQHGLKEAFEKGYRTLYLSTDLEGYYEKYDWTHSGNMYGPDGGQIKLYEKSTE
ncbi:hypothetical protein KR50_13360 [Jeotgalibacillus campisalis]|uniref:N-acetyltransferase domain-containing protein n=1 Tax=Jeotgalibacillus campisalis TaxID=220754 RepID=A0A0C2VX81_9BACL|nr:hypothetical protein KR50_13360 [Jeotgalibacillus campisalis]